MATQPRPVRYRCELYARVEALGGAAQARVLEVSEVGAFIEECEALGPLQVDDAGLMTLALPGGDPWAGRFQVRRLGTSRREVRDRRADHLTVVAHGYGVEFQGVDDDELERLRDFLELLELR